MLTPATCVPTNKLSGSRVINAICPSCFALFPLSWLLFLLRHFDNGLMFYCINSGKGKRIAERLAWYVLMEGYPRQLCSVNIFFTNDSAESKLSTLANQGLCWGKGDLRASAKFVTSKFQLKLC